MPPPQIDKHQSLQNLPHSTLTPSMSANLDTIWALPCRSNGQERRSQVMMRVVIASFRGSPNGTATNAHTPWSIYLARKFFSVQCRGRCTYHRSIICVRSSISCALPLPCPRTSGKATASSSRDSVVCSIFLRFLNFTTMYRYFTH